MQPQIHSSLERILFVNRTPRDYMQYQDTVAFAGL